MTGRLDGDSSTRLSVIVVTHNSADVIERCIDSLRSSLPLCEVVVVDNCSRDETRARCANAGGVTLIENDQNVGYGRACNQGAVRATASHLMFVNPDVELIDVDLNRLAAELGVRPFGLIGPLVQTGGRGVQAVFRHRHWIQDLLHHVTGPLVPREMPILPRLPIRRSARWLSGALLVVARDEFLAVGGFDKRFFLYYEDRDLARRYAAAQLPIRVTTALSLRHGFGRSSTGAASGSEIRNGWSYLSWIQYLYIWHGPQTARRAARSARFLRIHVDNTLAVVERGGPLSARAKRKRAQLREADAFVSLQSSFADGAAPSDYCPEARNIAAGTEGS